MTNKEWLATLDDEDLTYLFLGGLINFSRRSTDSKSCVMQWLQEQYNEEAARMYFPYLRIFSTKGMLS